MSKNVVEYEERGKCALIRLNRPEVHNAVNDVVIGRLEEIQKILNGRPETLVTILTGSGKDSFCSGGDVRYFAGIETRGEALAMSRRMQVILSKFKTGNQVVIAAVNGNAFGGGCEILTACHYRIAAERALFSFRQAANGIITGWGGGVRLFNQIDRSEALRLLLTSVTFDAQRARAIRFIDQVVPVSVGALESAMNLADQINKNSPSAVHAFLQIFQKIEQGDSGAAVEFETERFGDMWTGDDFKQWLDTFLNNPLS